jgi:exonuclease 3'-5' domain-containing protein 1
MAYMLCTTLEHLNAAIVTLSHSEYLALDCEGRELGMRGGALSLLSIGTAGGTDVFLIDTRVLLRDTPNALCTPAVRALVALLGRADVHKIVWDGRMDALALRESLGAALAGALDLQIGEVVSRATRPEENDQKRRERLVFVTAGRSLHWPGPYQEMHALLGLEACLTLCKVGLEHKKSGQ